ncbi:hypothetical protein ACHQM5_003565 [Ranunculus cassubicifolius]
MEKEKPSTTTTSTDMFATKAAAWAWYQRGGLATDDKSTEEAGVRRINRVSRPSRFKIEAAKKIANKEAERHSLELSRNSSIQSQNSLLDSYEIEMISKHFDTLRRHASDTYRHRLYGYVQDHSEKPLLQGKKIIHRKKSNGFWLVKPSAICGSSGDVVEPMSLARKHHHRRLHHS